MPVTAARLADIGARDSHPLVLGRRRQHFLEQLAIAGLEFFLLAQGLMGDRDPLGQGIANLLQLLEPGNPGHGETGRNLGVEGEAREGLGAETGQLVLETADLTAQLSAREALVASHSKRLECVSIEQIRHKSRFECRSLPCG
jgi:hypothetical protein